MFRRVLLAVFLVGIVFPLTNINSCFDLNSPNEVYNLTADIGCTGACSCINITASNVTLQCNGFNINGSGDLDSYGVKITGVEGAEVRDCNITNFRYATFMANANFSSITNNTFYNNGDGTTLSYGASNNTIQNNQYSNPPGWGTGIWMSSGSSYNLVINNTINSLVWGMFIASPYNNLTSNNLTNNNVALLVIPGSQPCLTYVDASNIAGGSGDPIYFAYDSDGITIENLDSYAEVLLCNVSNSIVRNVTMADGDGIIISYSGNNQFYNNSIAGAYYGHYDYISDNNTFYDTTVSSTQYGFEISGSDHATVCNSTLTSNSIGINISSSEFGHLCNLNIANSSSRGITMDYSANNNTVQNVTIPTGQYGISVTDGAYDNKIYNLTMNVTVTGISASRSSSGNTYTDITIYTTASYGIQDEDGGDTFTNVYINSSAGSFLYNSTALSTFTNLTLARNANTVNFPGTFSASNWTDSRNINMASDFVSINSSSVPELNQSANVTTYVNNCTGAKIYSLAGFPSSRGTILSTGSECLSCNLISCSGNTIQFDVPEFTGYAASTPPLDCVNLSDSFTWGDKIANVSGILYVNKNTTLCQGTYSLSGTSDTPLIEMNASNILFDCNGSTINGNDLGYGLYMNGKENNTVRNCTFMDYQYGPYLLSSDYNTLTEIAANGNSYGIYLSSSDSNTLTNNTASNNPYGILLSSSHYNNLTNNTANGNSYGIYLSDSQYNNLTNNTANSNSYGVYLYYSSTNTLTNNTADGNTNSGFHFEAGSGNVAMHNLAYSNLEGFYLYSTSSNTLTDNSAGSNTYGLHLYYSSTNTLADNTASSNSYGFYLQYSDSNNLTSSNASGNTNSGHVLYYSSYNTLSSLSSNGQSGGPGVFLQGSNYNNISDASIYDNALYGLYLKTSASSNIITRNTVYNNTPFQMMLEGGSGNLVYNNIFNATGSQGVVNGTVDSLWNTSKTLGPNIIGGAYIGGNYYSDYNGTDSDGDGIGQTVYTVYSYAGTTYSDAYPSSQASTGAWTNFGNTYDHDWDTLGNASLGAEAFFNYTAPAGIGTSATIETKAGDLGGIVDSTINNGTGNHCLDQSPVQINVSTAAGKAGAVKFVLACWNYDASSWIELNTNIGAGTGSVNLYETKAIFEFPTSANSTDYLPLTNNPTAAGCVNLSDPTTWGGRVGNYSGVLYVFENITLCNGTYEKTPLVINMTKTEVDGNGSRMRGDRSGVGVTSRKNQSKVKNLRIENYSTGIRLEGHSDDQLINLILDGNTGYGIDIGDASNSLIQDVKFINQPKMIATNVSVNVSDLTFVNGSAELHFGTREVQGDLDENNIRVGSDFVAVNSDAYPWLDGSATIKLPVPSCSNVKIFKKSGFPSSKEEILQDGARYYPPDLSCEDGVATFSVTGFSGYAAGGETSLTIDNDGPKYANETITFNASYVNTTSGDNITGADCNLTLWNGSSYMMGAVGGHYELSLNVTELGTHDYNVTCNKTGYETLTALDTFTIFYNSTLEGVGLYAANITLINTSRYSNNLSEANLTTQGGNVSEVILYLNTSTDRWAGFYGNITGSKLLAQANDTIYLYNWTWNSSYGGVVCTSTGSSPPSEIMGATYADIDTAWSFPPSATDSAANTFNNPNCSQSFGPVTLANAYYADTGYAGGFITCAWKSITTPAKDDMLFCTNITGNGPLYNGRSGDYELIVPTAYGLDAYETYYFYLNLA